MISIRLSRIGRKHSPTYRVVVMPKTRDPWAKNIEIVGNYNPTMNPAVVNLDAERIKYWLSQGAQATDAVHNLLVSEKIIDEKKRGVTHLTKKRREKLAAKASA